MKLGFKSLLWMAVLGASLLIPSSAEACRRAFVQFYQDTSGTYCGTQVCYLSSESIGWGTGTVYCHYDCGDISWRICQTA